MPNSNKIVSNKKVDEAYASYIASQNNNRIENNFKTLLAVIVGSVIMAFNMRSFIEQGNLVPGGINGIVVLIQRVSEKFFNTQIPFSVLSFLFNCFPAYLAYKTVGKKFTIFSCLCIAIMSVIIDFMPGYPITYDPLLIAVFGGIIQGLALSLILNAGASSGGTDFVAMYFSVKKGITTWNYVLLFNAIVVTISGMLFGMDVALYTIIFQFVQTQMLNTLYKKYAKKTVFIVTDMPQEVSEKIMAVTHHSATMYRAEGAYTHQPRYMIYTIIGADEVQQVRKQVRSVDNKAFINIMSSDTVSGNFYVRPLS